MLEEFRLSDYGRLSVDPSPVNRMMMQFASDFRDGVDINLGVGYVNENTIPRQLIKNALEAVLADPKRYRCALNYGSAVGSQNLIESLRQYLIGYRVGGLTEEILARNRIIIGGNGASSILEAIAEVLPPGIVITSDPVYYIYCNFLERKGYEILAVPEDHQGIRVDLLQKALEQLGPRCRQVSFVYLVTVNNPSCTILSTERRKQLLETITELSQRVGRKIPIFFDRAYEDLIHDPATPAPVSALCFDEIGLVHEIGTLSKILAPALRIGYMIGRDSPLMKAIVQKTSDSGFSAPLICQEMASWILDNHLKDQISRVNAGYREKATATRTWIDQYLGEFLQDCTGGKAGFYFYLTFSNIETHTQSAFFRFLTRTTGDEAIDGPSDNPAARVIYIPGQFCVHKNGQLTELGRRQLRLSYGFEELPQIHRALQLMQQAAQFALQNAPATH